MVQRKRHTTSLQKLKFQQSTVYFVPVLLISLPCSPARHNIQVPTGLPPFTFETLARLGVVDGPLQLVPGGKSVV